jgi:hypothetical protein
LPGAGADGGWANFQNLRNGPTRVLVHAKSSLASSAADEQELRAIQPGLDLDDQRALVIARRQDIACTLAPVEDAYVDFLEAIGVGPGRGRIVTPAAEPAAAGLPLPERLTADLDTLRWIASLVAADEPVVLEPYIASDAEFALAQALGTALGRDVPVSGGGADVVARANAKHEVRALAEALAIPIADGEIVSLEGRDGGAKFDATPLGPALEHRLRATGRVVLRGSSGAGGSSVRVVERTAESVRAALDWAAGRTHDPIYLVEVMLPVTVSPNIQMSVDEGGLHCVGITDQG